MRKQLKELSKGMKSDKLKRQIIQTLDLIDEGFDDDEVTLVLFLIFFFDSSSLQKINHRI